MSNSIGCLCELSYIFLTVISTTLMIVAYCICNNTNTIYLASVANNWNTGVLIDTTNSVTQCSANGYSTFISKPWPGTVTGCYSGSFYRGACSKKSYGTTYGALPHMAYRYWRGQPLCSTRVAASYLDLNIVDNENSCPLNYRSCGKIDTSGNFMCVPVATPCPMNYFKVIPSGQPLPSGFNYTSINLSGATLITSNSNVKGDLLVELDLSEGPPCADPNYKNYLSAPFILELFYGYDKCYTSVFSNVYDPYFQQADEYSYYNAYAENGVIQVMNTLPTFSSYSFLLQTSQRTLKLYYRNYIGVKPSCLKYIQQNVNLGKDIITDLSQIYSNSGSVQTALQYGLIFGAVSTGSLFIMIITNLCSGMGSLKRRFVLYLTSSFLHIAVFITSCISVAKLSGLSFKFQVLTDMNCVDQALTQMITGGISNSGLTNAFSIAALVTSLLTLLAYSLCVVSACYSDDY